jgi:hypothetical protein
MIYWHTKYLLIHQKNYSLFKHRMNKKIFKINGQEVVNKTLNILLVFDTWERNFYIWEKLTCVTHFLPLFDFNSWYLHLLIYYKYMLNFQWGLFCKLGFGVTFFKLLHIKLDMNFIFTWSSCIFPRVFWNTFLTFLQISHMSLWPNSM